MSLSWNYCSLQKNEKWPFPVDARNNLDHQGRFLIGL